MKGIFTIQKFFKKMVSLGAIASMGIFTSNAQQINGIWGVMQNSNNGNGLIYTLSTDGTNYAKMHEFKSKVTDGSDPNGTNLIAGPGGYLYGLTTQGGYEGYGNFFKIKPDGSGYENLLELGYIANGSNPRGKLIKASDGLLYGTTTEGGEFEYGTIFKIDFTGKFTKIYDFNQQDGTNSRCGLVEGADGYLYGNTSEGGQHDYGTLFKISKSGDQFTVLHHFGETPEDGHTPRADNLIVGGKLYGTTRYGGYDNNGTIYRINPDGAGYEKIYDFNDNGNNGYDAYAPLYAATDGYIYGTTRYGGYNDDGTIFRFNTSMLVNSTVSGTVTGMSTLTGIERIMDFDYNSTGSQPRGYPLYFADGNMYVITSEGGPEDAGVLSKFGLSTITYNPTISGITTLTGAKIMNLNYSRIGNVRGEMLDFNGAFYMMGRESGNGGIISVAKDGSSYQTLYRFYDNSGQDPYSSLVKHPNGKIYGTTYQGGSNNYGVIFSLTDNGTFTKEFDFNDYNKHGQYPYSGLTLAPNGKFYGNTQYGGNNGNGIIYEFDPVNSKFTKIMDFDYSNTGANPLAPMITLPGDNLFYTTQNSNQNGAVGIVSIPGVGSSVTGVSYYRTIAYSEGADLNYSRPAYDPISNAVYFATWDGGANNIGSILSVTFSGTTTGFAKKYDFNNNASGIYRARTGLVAVNGMIYGMAYYGGANGIGGIYRFNPSATTVSGFTQIFDFNSNSNSVGGYPYENQLTVGPDGWIYGMNDSYAMNNGSIFKFDPANSTFAGSDFKVVYAFGNTDGGNNRKGGLLFTSACINAPVAIVKTAEQILCGLSALSAFATVEGSVNSVQWFKGSTPVIGATSVSFSIPSLSASDAGSYYVRAIGVCGTATSANFDVTVKPTISAFTTITSVAICQYSPLVLPIMATGSVTSVNWYKDNVDLPYNGQTLTINAFSTSDAGVYSVKLSGECNTVSISGITLTVTSGGCVSGIEEGISNEISIYPNPGTGKIYINATQDGVYQILNTAGALLIENSYSTSNSGLVETGLSSGIYILKVKTASGSSKVFKLIIE